MVLVLIIVATTYQVEVMQAAPTSGIAESNPYDAYITCL